MASSPIEILLEMGFPRHRAEKSLVMTGNQGAEVAMEWLLEHSDDPEIDNPVQVTELNNSPDNKQEDSQQETMPVDSVHSDNSEDPTLEGISSAQSACSLKCDECGKLFKSEVEVEYHAIKSGHQSFSESSEEIKPLSEEEKREKLKRLEEKIKQRRMMKEVEERKERIEREKTRRRTGQEMIEIKKRVEEEEMKRIADQRKKEKMEDKLARQRVLEQIERDKQARREKFAVNSQSPSASSQTNVQAPSVTNEPITRKEYTETKLQIRLTNGTAITQSFGSKEELAAVRLFVEMNRTDGGGPFTLMTSFPKRVFTEEDMEKPLCELGLVPSAVLILGKGKSS